MSNVIPLGNNIPASEPIVEVIEELELLLARARVGEVRSLAYVLVDGGDYTTTGWVLGSSNAAMLVGAVTRLQFTITNSWENKCSPDDTVA